MSPATIASEQSRAAQVAAWIELAHAAEPADPSVAGLVSALGPVEVVDRIRTGRSGLRHQEGMKARLEGVRADDARARAVNLGARIITRDDREWPSQLDALGPSTPFALWVQGAANLRLLGLRSVSIVGARACTAYGEEITRSWAGQLAAQGWTIVSGAAFGIDAAAHRAALSAGGVTIALVAGGVDVPYPRAHAALLAAIADQGLIVSEVPPGEAVRRQRFLSRNRLIAALGRVTVVVEAAERSGTTATARAAAGLLRPVLAVPGPVTSPASAGCHRMVQEGVAQLASDLDDVASALDLDGVHSSDSGGASGRDPRQGRDRLAQREQVMLDALPTRGWATLSDLVRASGLRAGDVAASVGMLVAGGWLEEGPSGWRRSRVPAP